MSDIYIKVIQGIFCIGFVLIVHELGHLIAARLFNVRVQKFSIFLSPFFSIVRWKPGRYIKFFVSKNLSERIEQKNIDEDLKEFESIRPRSWKDTEYVLGWIPIAGYCRFDTQYSRHDDETKSEVFPDWDIRNLHSWKRLFLTLAGIIANIICAIVIFFCLDFFAPKHDVHEDEESISLVRYSPYAKKIGFRDEDHILKADSVVIDDALINLNKILNSKSVQVLRGNDTLNIMLPPAFKDSIINECNNKLFNYYFIYYSQLPLVKSVEKHSIADSIGIKRGDLVVFIDSVRIQSTSNLFYLADERVDSLVTFTFARATSDYDWNIFKHSFKLPRNCPIAGMTFTYNKSEYFDIVQQLQDSIQNEHNSASAALEQTKNLTESAAKSYIPTKKENNEHKEDNISGVIGIINIYPNEWNWPFWWYTVGVFSIGVAIFNLLPIPGLDGGQAIFCLLEIILRRKLNENILGYINGISWLLLMIWILWSNIKWIFNFF